MELRAVIMEDTDHDPSDYLSGDELDRRRGEIANGEIVVVGVLIQEMCDKGYWHPAGHSLWGIEVDPAAPSPFPLSPADIPAGPFNVLSGYGFRDISAVPENLTAPFTASDNYLVQVACDLMIDARDAS